jgi:hypothetical protein
MGIIMELAMVDEEGRMKIDTLEYFGELTFQFKQSPRLGRS